MSYTFPPVQMDALPGWGLWISRGPVHLASLLVWSPDLPLALATDPMGTASGTDYRTVRVYVPDALWKVMAVMETGQDTRLEVLTTVNRAVQRTGPAALERLGTLYHLGADARALYALVDGMGAV